MPDSARGHHCELALHALKLHVPTKPINHTAFEIGIHIDHQCHIYWVQVFQGEDKILDMMILVNIETPQMPVSVAMIQYEYSVTQNSVHEIQKYRNMSTVLVYIHNDPVDTQYVLPLTSHTVKPVYNDHLMGYFSAFWSSLSWPRAT